MVTLEEIRKLETSGDWKTKVFRYGNALIAFEAVTGIYLLFVSKWNSIGMMLLLGHIALGFLMIVPCVMFSIRHARYRAIWGDRAFGTVGAVTAAALFVSLFSGVYLTVDGVTGHGIMWWIHNSASFLGVFGIILYTAMILRRAMAHFGKKSEEFILKVAVKTVGIVMVLMGLGVLGCVLGGRIYRDPNPQIVRSEYRYPFEGQSGFFPAPLTTPNAQMLNPKLFTNSKSCGTMGCHTEILKQWEQSVHFHTPNYFVLKSIGRLYEEADSEKTLTRSDHPYFKKLRAAHPGHEMARFCSGCHAPVALLSGAVTQSKPLTDFHEFEGISCVLCHSISQFSAEGKAQGFTVTAPQRYLFWDSKNPVGEMIYKTLIRTKPEFHKRNFMNPSYKTAEYCATCHRPLQYASWAAGPYHDEIRPENSKACQRCHMADVKTDNDVSARSKDTVTNHRFLSEGFTMAQVYGVPEQYRLTEKFLQDKKMVISAVAPKKISPGGKLRFTVRIANVGVGHMFPAGVEGDLVETWPEVVVKNDAGRILFQYGIVRQDGYLDDKKTHIYRVLPFDSDERPMDLEYHRSWRFAKDVMDTIPPRQYDDVPFEVRLSPGSAGRHLQIFARLRYRKPNQQYMDFVFGRGKVHPPIVDVASGTTTVDIESDPKALALAKTDWEKELRNPIGLDGMTRRSSGPLPYSTRIDVESNVMLGEINELRKQGDARSAREMYEELPPVTRLMVDKKRIAAEKNKERARRAAQGGTSVSSPATKREER
jgi:hypothetical protein